ncbi:hypothetical protein CMO91_00785 [Candidatus Woesearchaeota archaeon]|nr:hypothetical protein [Candidatus Woesearchaeota archaeon]
MIDVYYAFDPVQVLYLGEGLLITPETYTQKTFTDTSKALNRRIQCINDQELESLAQETVNFFPGSLARNAVQEYLDQLHPRLYGSNVDPSVIMNAFESWFGKTRTFEKLHHIPNLTAHVIGQYDSHRLRKNSPPRPFMIKAAYGCGGTGNKRIQSLQELYAFLAFVESGGCTLEREDHEQYLIEEILPVARSPASSLFVRDDSIEILGAWDQTIVQGRYNGATYPSETKHQERLMGATLHIGELLQEEGYRGPTNVDFMETDEGIYISEVNLRYGYSHCIAAYAQDRGIEQWVIVPYNDKLNKCQDYTLDKRYAVSWENRK